VLTRLLRLRGRVGAPSTNGVEPLLDADLEARAAEVAAKGPEPEPAPEPEKAAS
jgi:hypothetical protein